MNFTSSDAGDPAYLYGWIRLPYGWQPNDLIRDFSIVQFVLRRK